MIYAIVCVAVGAFVGVVLWLLASGFFVAIELLIELHYLAAGFRRERREAKHASTAPLDAAEAPELVDPDLITQPEYDALFAQITDCPITEQHRDRRNP